MVQSTFCGIFPVFQIFFPFRSYFSRSYLVNIQSIFRQYFVTFSSMFSVFSLSLLFSLSCSFNYNFGYVQIKGFGYDRLVFVPGQKFSQERRSRIHLSQRYWAQFCRPEYISDSVLWKTRSGARINQSVRVHKALFHFCSLGIVRDIVSLSIRQFQKANDHLFSLISRMISKAAISKAVGDGSKSYVYLLLHIL